jgi:NAD(P)-dependent dehydrogenase (short-subunit alcohol dehydrogenase family)
MGNRVANKVAVVFGGGQTPGLTIGNGRATSAVLAREGAHVVVVDRDVASAQETVAMIAAAGGSAQAMQVDQTHENDVQSLLAAVHREHHRIDIVHNNIGASLAVGDATADVLTESAFDASFAVNVKSAWFAAKHALPFMRAQGHGSIVSISSVASIQAYPLLGYKTMKAALNAMTENMAAGNAKYGVRVNAILPGLMNTPMAIENRVAKGHQREDVVADRDRRIPLKGKQGTGWDVAHAALFLHSDEASFITGVTLVVDGGETIAHGH